ncbi:MAG: ATP-grasp domain-containing protein [Bacteroidota bacterium]
MNDQFKNLDFFQLESNIWLAEKKTHIPAYDFCFEPLFKVSRPRISGECPTVARIGAIDDYPNIYDSFIEYGYKLINNVDQHKRASELEYWYPLIKAFTPKSVVYDTFPNLDEVLQELSFPIFIKGNRQSAKHDRSLSIAKDEEGFNRIKEQYPKNNILHWQKVVCREFVALQQLKVKHESKVPLSFEFRTFWWYGECVGTGHYWSQHASYSWTEEQKSDALAMVKKAIEKIDIPFLVVDLALTKAGDWIIIEFNDAQEAGYCGVQPIQLWHNITALNQSSSENLVI